MDRLCRKFIRISKLTAQINKYNTAYCGINSVISNLQESVIFKTTESWAKNLGSPNECLVQTACLYDFLFLCVCENQHSDRKKEKSLAVYHIYSSLAPSLKAIHNIQKERTDETTYLFFFFELLCLYRAKHNEMCYLGRTQTSNSPVNIKHVFHTNFIYTIVLVHSARQHVAPVNWNYCRSFFMPLGTTQLAVYFSIFPVLLLWLI